jgi:hypothetical protein
VCLCARLESAGAYARTNYLGELHGMRTLYLTNCQCILTSSLWLRTRSIHVTGPRELTHIHTVSFLFATQVYHPNHVPKTAPDTSAGLPMSVAHGMASQSTSSSAKLNDKKYTGTEASGCVSSQPHASYYSL